MRYDLTVMNKMTLTHQYCWYLRFNTYQKEYFWYDSIQNFLKLNLHYHEMILRLTKVLFFHFLQNYILFFISIVKKFKNKLMNVKQYKSSTQAINAHLIRKFISQLFSLLEDNGKYRKKFPARIDQGIKTYKLQQNQMSKLLQNLQLRSFSSLICQLVKLIQQKLQQLMKLTQVFMMLIISISANPISASLKIVQYQPTIFQLKFSEMVKSPKFQLIFNNAQELNYELITTDASESTFYFQATSNPTSRNYILEHYQIMFNEPLSIGSGRLSTQYFKILAQKERIEIPQNEGWGVVLVIAGYLLINFSSFGMILIQFMSVYCLIAFRAHMHTALYENLSNGLFLLNPDLDEAVDDQSVYIKMCLPSSIVILAGIVGILVKKIVKNRDTVLRKLFYEIFVYDVFVNVSLVLIVPLFLNSFQFLSLLSTDEIEDDPILKGLGIYFSYLGILLCFGLLYLFIYSLNPKIKESEESWQKYMKSNQFISFRRLHQTLKVNNWYTRNQKIFVVLKRLIVVSAFLQPQGFEGCIFLMEFLTIIGMFVLQPFKEAIYLNIVAACRLFMLIFYGMILIEHLYYSMGEMMINYNTSVKPFFIAGDIVFLFTCLAISIAIIYEIYVKCSNFNYKVKLVREENDFKLKIIQRNKTQSSKSDQQKKKPVENSDYYYQRQKTGSIGTSIRNRDQTCISSISPKKKRNLSQIKKKRAQQFEESHLVRQNTRKEIDQSIMSQSTKMISSERSISKDRIKWKKTSLLASIIKQK